MKRSITQSENAYAYAASKSVVMRLTESMSAELKEHGINVNCVMPSIIDTEMNRGFNIPKASTESAAQGIFNGLEKGEEDIFPDPVSQSISEGWRAGPVKAMERQFAAFVPEKEAVR